MLTKTKPNNILEKTRNCVYSIPCECQEMYIGETGRPLEKRVVEHKANVRKMNVSSSKMAEHVYNKDHNIKWEDSKILLKEADSTKRKMIESACIMNNNEKCFSESSVYFHPTWLIMIEKDLPKF